MFTGFPVRTVEDAKKACLAVLARAGFHLGVIVTLGEQGAVFGDRRTGELTCVSTRKVQAVDTTVRRPERRAKSPAAHKESTIDFSLFQGAGDAFLGSLAHYICKLGVSSLPDAIEKACEYATMSVMGRGTQASYPRLNADS